MAKPISDLFKLNPFAVDFANARDKDEVEQQLLSLKNSRGVSKEELDSYLSTANLGYGYYSDADISYLDMTPLLDSKRARIAKYREMSMYPEIMDAVDAIVNDSVVDNGDGKIVELIIDKKKKMPSGIKKRIYAAFEYWIRDVLKLQEKGDEYFRRWLVEGEIYAELIPDNKGANIVGIKVLPAFTMAPVYRKGKIIGFVQVVNVVYKMFAADQIRDDSAIEFEPNQISYSNYGLYGENLLDVRGYLESSVRTYNQLKSLEDSIVVYRLVRAPERRIWNIYTGRMPKGKAEEYIKGLMRRYKRKSIYDPNTGAIDSAQNVQAMSHDFWFSKDDSGQQSNIDTIGGAMNLGEITDLDWFKEKLYKSLRLPSSRWQVDQKQGPYSSGKMGEVTREEIKFARFIERLQRKFKFFILNPFITLLHMRGIPEEYIDKSWLDIKFTESNLFKQYKEIELREARLGILSSVVGYIATRSNINESEGLFSKEYVLREFFKMSDVEYELNQKLIKKELADDEEIADEFPPILPPEEALPPEENKPEPPPPAGDPNKDKDKDKPKP